MTKEQLEKEARINLKRRFGEFFPQLTISYVMGAEPREKQIQIDAEQIRALQKQNGELTDKVKELKEELIEADNATDVFNAQEKRIEELEQENAELRKQQFSLRNERNTFLAQNEQYEKDLIDFNEQLTKAKGLLKRFIETSNPIYFEEDRQKVKAEAEQFLKD